MFPSHSHRALAFQRPYESSSRRKYSTSPRVSTTKGLEAKKNLLPYRHWRRTSDDTYPSPFWSRFPPIIDVHVSHSANRKRLAVLDTLPGRISGWTLLLVSIMGLVGGTILGWRLKTWQIKSMLARAINKYYMFVLAGQIRLAQNPFGMTLLERVKLELESRMLGALMWWSSYLS